MNPLDVILIFVILLIVVGASYYIYRAKKGGKKCIGCPYADRCGGVSCGCSCSQNNDDKK